MNLYEDEVIYAETEIVTEPEQSRDGPDLPRISKEDYLALAAKRYEKMRAEHPAQRCVGITSAGKQCKRWAIRGTNLCDDHGGSIDKRQLAPISAEKPKRKKFKLSGRLEQIRNAISEDAQNILDSTEEIEVLSARLQWLLDDATEFPLLSKEVFRAYDTWVEAKRGGNAVRFAEQTARLQAALEDARRGSAAMQELYVNVEALRRMKETEMKRRIAMRQMMDAGDAARLAEACMNAVERGLQKVESPEERRAFKKAFVAGMRDAFMPPKDKGFQAMRVERNPME